MPAKKSPKPLDFEFFVPDAERGEDREDKWVPKVNAETITVTEVDGKFSITTSGDLNIETLRERKYKDISKARNAVEDFIRVKGFSKTREGAMIDAKRKADQKNEEAEDTQSRLARDRKDNNAARHKEAGEEE